MNNTQNANLMRWNSETTLCKRKKGGQGYFIFSSVLWSLKFVNKQLPLATKQSKGLKRDTNGRGWHTN